MATTAFADVHRPEGVDDDGPVDPRSELNCAATIIRVGEIFGEFGVALTASRPPTIASPQPSGVAEPPAGTSAPGTSTGSTEPLGAAKHQPSGLTGPAAGAATIGAGAPLAAGGTPTITMWRLRVTTDGHVLVFDDIVRRDASKVIKLAPATAYLLQTRVWCEEAAAWGHWSPLACTRTFPAVQTSIDELCEEHVRVVWDRPVRDTSHLHAEQRPDLMEGVANIAHYQLRIIREVDSHVALQEEFDEGTRSYTITDLRPGTAYIVFACYATLIGTMKQWAEVARFCTQASHVLEEAGRGEDQVTVSWSREPLPSRVGYFVPESTIHKYELTLEMGSEPKDLVELPASQAQHTFTSLAPSTTYRVRFRSLTKEGRWGSRTTPITMRTADNLTVAVCGVGETFATVEWSRMHEEEGMPADVEAEVVSTSGAFRRVFVTQSRNGQVSLDGLAPGTGYHVRLRTRLFNCWGVWTHATRFQTRERTEVLLCERGENFLSVRFAGAHDPAADDHVGGWDARAEVAVPRWRFLLFRLAADGGERELVMEEETAEAQTQRIDGLEAETTYEVQAQVWQVNPFTGDASWGELSTPVRGRTLAAIQLQLVDVGEHFANVAWSRDIAADEADPTGGGKAPAENADSSAYATGYTAENHHYEITLAVPNEGSDLELHKEVLSTSHRLTNLRPNTTYIVSVRARNGRNQWGRWYTLKFHTLATMQLTTHRVGEDYVRLLWCRGNDAVRDGQLDTLASLDGLDSAGDFVSSYQLLIFADNARAGVGGPAAGGPDVPCPLRIGDAVVGEYHRGGDSDDIRCRVVSAQHEATRVGDLCPDRTYVAVLRAATASNEWGMWSPEVRFRTVSPFRIVSHDLRVGENYVKLSWDRDEAPAVDRADLGDRSVIEQKLRYVRLEHDAPWPTTTTEHEDSMRRTPVHAEQRLAASLRDFKIERLEPDRAYSIQLQGCNSSGEWGRWSAPVTIQTRPRLKLLATEVAEDSAALVWERANDPRGRKIPHVANERITQYELRVTPRGGPGTGRPHPPIRLDPHLGHKVEGLAPDTFYCLEIKALYDNDVWGLWSPQLWVLTMKQIEVRSEFIGETHLKVRVIRQPKTDRMPDDDGVEPHMEEGATIAYGSIREFLHLCVSTKQKTKAPYATIADRRNKDSRQLPPECAGEALFSRVTIPVDSGSTETVHIVSNLQSNTEYSVTARSARSADSQDAEGSYGMWSNSLRVLTQAPIRLRFTDIGEDYVTVDWRREAQDVEDARVKKGLDSIERSRVKFREANSAAFCEPRYPEDGATSLTLRGLNPASTYHVIVSTYSDDFHGITASGAAGGRGDDGFGVPSVRGNRAAGVGGGGALREDGWGRWSTEAKVRTMPPMGIYVDHIGEEAVWLSWMRQSDLGADLSSDTALCVDTEVKNCELEIRDDSTGFCARRENAVSDSARNKIRGGRCFFRGLMADRVYEVRLRAQSRQGWGRWSTQLFRTLPLMNISLFSAGEQFVNIELRRANPNPLTKQMATAELVEPEDIVEMYRLKVKAIPPAIGGVIADQRPVVYELQPSVSRFCLDSLNPATEYKMWVCARGHEGVWGQWNQFTSFYTRPQLDLTVADIGEDYVIVKWERARGRQEGGADEVTVNQFEVKIEDAQGEVVLLEKVDAKSKTWEPNLGQRDLLRGATQYSVSVRAKDTYNKWGLWSPPKRFVTLPPVGARLLCVGEDFVKFEWDRQTFLEDRPPPSDQSDADASAEGDVEETEDEEAIEGSSSGGRVGDRGESASHDPFPFDSTDVFDHDLLRGTEEVRRWRIRLTGPRLSATQPPDKDYLEEEIDVGDEGATSTVLRHLQPQSRYEFCVQALNSNGQWGRWTQTITFVTLPLVRVNLTYVGEDFLTLEWQRPSPESVDPARRATAGGAEAADQLYAALQPYYCFPPDHSARNYHVFIAPLEKEAPFDEDDALVDGGRRYPSTQKSMRINKLRPGTRYRILVREQKVEEGRISKLAKEDGSDEVFGVYSDAVTVETMDRMAVSLDSVSENSAVLEWGRDQRTDRNGGGLTNKPTAKVISYDLQVVRKGDRGGDLADFKDDRKFRRQFQSGTANFTLNNLMPNAIYGARIRAQTDGNHWGLWSEETMFVTLKKLSLRVEQVNEDSIVVVWIRNLPDWLLADGADDLDEAEAEALDRVQKGSYDVSAFEVTVAGIGHHFDRTYSIPASERAAHQEQRFHVTGLTPDSLYEVYVRSECDGRWSDHSLKVAVCTLKQVDLAIGRYTEHFGTFSWSRPQQSVSAFERVLSEAHTKERAAFNERLQAVGEQVRELIDERNAQGLGKGDERDEATHDVEFQYRMLNNLQGDVARYLEVHNVVMGTGDATAFHLRIIGDCGTPFIQGTAHLLEQKRRRATVRRPAPPLGTAARQARSKSRKATQALLSPMAAQSLHPPSASVAADETADISAAAQMLMSGANDAERGLAEEVALEGDEAVLLDVRINSRTESVTVLGLTESSLYRCELRTRVGADWGLWSRRREVRTLALFNLQEARIGEHYANLFWHRLPRAVVQAADEERLAAEEDESRLEAEAEAAKAGADPEAYHAAMELFAEARARGEVAREKIKSWQDGHGEDVAEAHLKGYHLRVVHENGSVVGEYFAVGSARAFTVPRLLHNQLHVASVCPDYGDRWGLWSEPVKFMTQNGITLHIRAVSESYVDLQWTRPSNKKPPRGETNVITKQTVQNGQQMYEVRLRKNGGGYETRQVIDQTLVRIDDLDPDTRYDIDLREWDEKGDWGLWSSPVRACNTLPDMLTQVTDIAENWITLSWERLRSTIDNARYAEPPQNFASDPIAYFLRVRELDETRVGPNGMPLPLPDPTAPIDVDDEQLAAVRASIAKARAAARGNGDGAEGANTLPPAPPPDSVQPEVGAPFFLVEQMPQQMSDHKVAQMRPNRFYSVQIMCQTTRGHVGRWSEDVVVATFPKIRCELELADEEHVRVQWTRPPVRELRGARSGVYDCECFKVCAMEVPPGTAGAAHLGPDETIAAAKQANAAALEAVRIGEATEADVPFYYEEIFQPHEHQSHIRGLNMNRAYKVMVQSRDRQKGWSLWSDPAAFATQTRMEVRPMQLTEDAAFIEWGRSTHGQMPGDVRLPPPEAMQYQLRVTVPGRYDMEGNELVYEETFPGSVTQHALQQLEPNQAYTVSVRAKNVFNEWGIWSEQRVVYTMKPIVANVMAVGETYVMMEWSRPPPDERTETALREDGTAFVRFPLLDQPTEAAAAVGGAVYRSARTSVTHYAISMRRDDTMDAGAAAAALNPPLTVLPATAETRFKLSGLEPDGRYELAVRACYGDDIWGVWSPVVVTTTRTLFQVFPRGVGEDFLHAAWQRAPATAERFGAQVGQTEPTLCFQLQLHDFSDIAMGEEQLAEETTLIHDGLLRDSARETIIRKLNPHRQYRVLVRPWVVPVDALEAGVDPAAAGLLLAEPDHSTEEDKLRGAIEQSGAVPGEWSAPVFVDTLRPMVVSATGVAEDFVRLVVRRDPELRPLPPRAFATHGAGRHVTAELKIDEYVPDGSAPSEAPDALRLSTSNLQLNSHDRADCRFTDLRPDTTYCARTRCRAEGTWGAWSRDCLVVTLPLISVELPCIGEDYVTLKWGRRLRSVVGADGVPAETGREDTLERYQLEMVAYDQPFHLQKKFKASRTSYRFKRLDANTVYSVRVRSASVDSEAAGIGAMGSPSVASVSAAPGTATWSMWSEAVTFATLKPLRVACGKIGEQFAHVAWGRDTQTPEEYGRTADAIRLGTVDVASYHICVFPVNAAPATALLDRRFDGTVSSHCITSLDPNASYVVVIRAQSDGHWGMWSEELTLTTLRLIHLSVVSVGENYVTVSWRRDEPTAAAAPAALPPPAEGASAEAAEGAAQQGDEAGANALTTGASAAAPAVEPTEYRVGVSSETELRPIVFGSKDVKRHPVSGAPTFTVRGLNPDTPYVVTLQACYGDEWGLWTAPLTVLTLNTLGILVSNVTENRAEFTWGRKAQSPGHAYDPTTLVFASTERKYTLVVRTLDAYQRAEERRTTIAAEEIPAAAGAGGATLQLDAPEGDEDARVVERLVDVRNRQPQNFCLVDKLQCCTTYHVQLRAQDAWEEWGDWSPTLFETLPPPPRGLRLDKVASGQHDLYWQPPTDEVTGFRYQVEYIPTLKDRKGKPVAGTGAAAAADASEWREWSKYDGVTPFIQKIGGVSAKARFRVRCSRDAALWSKWAVLTPTGAPPDQVWALVVTNISRAAATVSWEHASCMPGADQSPTAAAAGPGSPATEGSATGGSKVFRVMIASGGSAQATQVGTTTTGVFELTDLTPATKYRVTIIVDGEGAAAAAAGNATPASNTYAFSTKGDGAAGGGDVSRRGVSVRGGSTDVRLPTIGSPRQMSRAGDTLTPRPPGASGKGGAQTARSSVRAARPSVAGRGPAPPSSARGSLPTVRRGSHVDGAGAKGDKEK